MNDNHQADLMLPPPIQDKGTGVPVPMPQAPSTKAPNEGSLGQAAVPLHSGGNPSLADDSDLIEKEWVNKAKEIVNQTKNDPLKQSEAISHLKADYMKKRYNKDIKLEKGQ